MSGGPVYRIIDAVPGKEVVDRVELLGMLYQQWNEMAFLSRPSFLINADGTIRM
jgi:hypothetical protein